MWGIREVIKPIRLLKPCRFPKKHLPGSKNLLGVFITTGIDTKRRIQGAISNQASQRKYTGNHQQYNSQGSGNNITKVQAHNYCGNYNTKDAVGSAHVLFHGKRFRSDATKLMFEQEHFR